MMRKWVLIALILVSCSPRLGYAVGFCPHTETMERYTCLIGAAAAGAARGQEAALLPAYKALAAMQTVQTLASSARYSLWATQTGFQVPSGGSQQICLDEGFGICGNHMLLFLDFMSRLGVPARSVEFYYSRSGRPESHAGAEFLLAGKWRFVDITYGSMWMNDQTDLYTIKSLDEAMVDPSGRVTSSLDPWLVRWTTSGLNPFIYLSATPEVVVDGEGKVRLHVSQSGEISLQNLPNYIGDNKADGRHQRIAMQLPAGASRVATVVVSGVGGPCYGSALLMGGRSFPVMVGTYSVEVENSTDITMVGSDDVCYAVISRIYAHN